MKKKLPTDFNSKEFKELQDKWYGILEEEGFVDIERHEKNFRAYRYGTSEKAGNQFSKQWRDSKIAYYQMASDFLSSHRFASNLDKVIWEYHTNGISIENITKLLMKIRIKTNRTSVWLIIKELREKMKKKYKVK